MAGIFSLADLVIIQLTGKLFSASVVHLQMRILVYCCILVLLLSCEKDINFNLIETEPLLVVDAQIENGKAPVVVLTKSLSYFSQVIPEILANSFVHGAEVYISNGIFTHRLKEYSYPIFGNISGYYYSIDSMNLATAFIGEFNTDYQLRILSESREYNSSTRIPSLANLPDSVWLRPAPQNPDTNKRVLLIKATDPPGRGNNMRYFTKRNSGNFLPGENSVFDDQVVDGTTYEVQFPQGIDRNNPPRSDDNFFMRGDTVTLKYCNIPRSTYIFWNTWEFAYQGIGNPFSQPNKVIGNVSNGALGAFCGYAAWYKTVIAL